MANQPTAEALWQFSLALYPKIQPLCLQWQDTFGLNVNMLLLLCYLEKRQLSLSASELEQLAATLNTFSQQFTQPLRDLRRRSNSVNLSVTQQQQLKQSLLAAELSLEQLEQQLLVTHCPALSSSVQPLIERYLSQLQADTPAIAQQMLDLRQAVMQLR
ncbi:TIGR02444 family protein [Arsukibacterium sp.]|uniref:TIGR02444 family protein n=1 Tax=Arsukibacterium sp. TaxID=1977258 RepID=UPI003567FC08